MNYINRNRNNNSPSSVKNINHNCRMWGAVSNDFEDSLIIKNLVTYPNSLKNLSQWANTDGWGIGYYPAFGDSLIIERSKLQAFYDPVFDSTVSGIDISVPKIILAHIRNCSSGCCCHNCETITNPHPFWRYKNGRYWSFAHNGHLDKAVLLGLIGEDYLTRNPPTGSGIPECDPSDTSLIVDSELYFLFLLMNIEANNWNVTDGIIEALSELIVINPHAYMNFILSDGENLWGFCAGFSLYYIDDSFGGYRAVASVYPSSLQGNWIRLNDYELVFFNADDSLNLLDIRFFLPPDFYIAGDSNGDLKFSELDITYSVNYLKGIGPAPFDTVYCSPYGMLMAAADANGSCAFNGLDVIFSVCYFRGIGRYPTPCPECPPIN
ncbi:MAG: class II glutamine amidotransferase [Candidatus Zixiibacteriota bacterium]|nr:MAG: class II glutamine amidotransferase [candidate division Zixibacteria bacterium]